MRVALAIAVLLVAGCERSQSISIITGEAMGTTYRIKYVGEIGRLNFDKLVKQLDADLSTWRDDSWVARFNRAPVHQPMDMPESVRDLVVLSQRLHAETEGRFDPAIGALIQAWGFGAWRSEFRSDPTEEQIEAARKASGLHRLTVENDKLKKTRDDLMLDFSAIAKGYAVDRMADELLAADCENFIIEFGGDLLAQGHAPGKTGWTVDGPALERPVTLINEAIATSGSQHQSRGGMSHVINPLLGRPVSVGIAASARAPTCAEADALATARLIEAAGK